MVTILYFCFNGPDLSPIARLCVLDSNVKCNTYDGRLPRQPDQGTGRTIERSLHCNQKGVFPVITYIIANKSYCIFINQHTPASTQCKLVTARSRIHNATFQLTLYIQPVTPITVTHLNATHRQNNNTKSY